MTALRNADGDAVYPRPMGVTQPRYACDDCNNTNTGMHGCPNCRDVATPPSDLAILRGFKRSEQRVLAEAETPADDIRNAIQMIGAFDQIPSDDAFTCFVVGADDLNALKARLTSALSKLDLLAEIDAKTMPDTMRHVMRLHAMTVTLDALDSRLRAVENLIDDKEADAAEMRTEQVGAL